MTKPKRVRDLYTGKNGKFRCVVCKSGLFTKVANVVDHLKEYHIARYNEVLKSSDSSLKSSSAVQPSSQASNRGDNSEIVAAQPSQSSEQGGNSEIVAVQPSQSSDKGVEFSKTLNQFGEASGSNKSLIN
ncbi:hypothetical protein OROHE_018520 [Orobanche hederae]